MKTQIIILLIILAACDTKQKIEPVKEQVVNVYSHRHYEIDKEIYAQFTIETGIKVNVIKAEADELIQKIIQEGKNSPADLLITVDAARLYLAKSKDLFQTINSKTLEANLNNAFQDKNNKWFGLTVRARVIIYDSTKIKNGEINDYEDLANKKWKGKITMRSSSNVYNQSLLAGMILAGGDRSAKNWAKGVVDNFVDAPKGNDRDQVKFIAGGKAQISIVNTYYLELLRNSEAAEERDALKNIAILYPNQNNRGTHINISGAGVLKYAPNKDNAIKLLEYLSAKEQQKKFADANYEFSVQDTNINDKIVHIIDFNGLGKLNADAVKIFDEAGWK